MAKSLDRAEHVKRQQTLLEFDSKRDLSERAFIKKCQNISDDMVHASTLARHSFEQLKQVLRAHNLSMWQKVESHHERYDEPEKFNNEAWEKSFGLLRARDSRNCSRGALSVWHYVRNNSAFMHALFEHFCEKIIRKMIDEELPMISNNILEVHMRLLEWAHSYKSEDASCEGSVSEFEVSLSNAIAAGQDLKTVLEREAKWKLGSCGHVHPCRCFQA